MKEVASDQDKQLRELAIAVAAGKARAQTAELTAIKGFTYEEMLQHGLASIASVHGDIAEPVGRRTGLTGTQKGDYLVTVNAEDTCGEEARFVLERKDRDLSMAKTMDELAKAMDNHAAQAAIAVFSRTEHSPNPLPFSWSGNRAVLVYDKETRTTTLSSSGTPGPGGSAAAISPPTQRRSTPDASRPPSPKPARRSPGTSPPGAASPPPPRRSMRELVT